MSDFIIKAGSTSQRLPIWLADSSSTTGAGLAGLTNASSGLTCYYWREDEGNAAATAVSLASATRGTFTSSGFVEKDATNQPGAYEFGIPNAAVAAGAKWVRVMFKGATNLAPRVITIRLIAADLDDATALGLSRIDAATSSRMATFTLPTNFSVLSISATTGLVDITQTAADKVWSTTTRTLSSFGTLIADTWAYLTSSITTAGSIGKLLKDNVDAQVSTRLATTGYTAPDNTSISAIKLKTDQLVFTVTNQLDVTVKTIVTNAVDALAVASDIVAEIADAARDSVFAKSFGSGYLSLTFFKVMKAIAAVVLGKTTGMGTSTGVNRDLEDTADVVTATLDGVNRSAPTVNL